MKKTGLTPGQVLVPVGIGLTFSLFGDATLYTVLPDAGIAAQAGVSLGMVGVLLGLNRLARVVFNGPAGILYDRFPRRKLMIAAIWIGVLSTVFLCIGLWACANDHGPGAVGIGLVRHLDWKQQHGSGYFFSAEPR